MIESPVLPSLRPAAPRPPPRPAGPARTPTRRSRHPPRPRRSCAPARSTARSRWHPGRGALHADVALAMKAASTTPARIDPAVARRRGARLLVGVPGGAVPRPCAAVSRRIPDFPPTELRPVCGGTGASTGVSRDARPVGRFPLTCPCIQGLPSLGTGLFSLYSPLTWNAASAWVTLPWNGVAFAFGKCSPGPFAPLPSAGWFR